MELIGERRTKLEIINDMLMAIQKKEGQIKPTHLMYKANLSHKLLKEYVEELMKKELVREIGEKNKMVVLTDHGLDFVIQFRKMKEFQTAFGL